MLKSFAQRHHLVLKKGQNFHILTQLVINYLLLAKLKFIKKIKGINQPIVHYYAVCWNEEKMLPFMFDYYGQFVDKFIIFDNYSTDGSEEIIRSHKNAKIIKFKTDGFNDFVHQEIKNNCWKKSRGKADYIVVCDMDEFIFHPDINGFLQSAIKQKISLPCSIGYDMYNDTFPKYVLNKTLPYLISRGVRDVEYYSKQILFDPHRIVEINYCPGAHRANPCGYVKKFNDESLKMLHFKNLGIDYILKRVRMYRERLSQENKDANCGTHYLEEESLIRLKFEEGLMNSSVVEL